jgi:hypothetical protein
VSDPYTQHDLIFVVTEEKTSNRAIRKNDFESIFKHMALGSNPVVCMA